MNRNSKPLFVIILLTLVATATLTLGLKQDTEPLWRQRPEVVKIDIVIKDAVYSMGTGFFIDDNKVMTAKHVVEGSRAYKVGGVSVSNIWRSPTHDVAILTVLTPKTEQQIQFGKAVLEAPTTVMTKVIEVDNVDLYIKGYVATRIFNNVGYFKTPTFELDSVSYPGYSGSPVVDTDNRVIGMVLGFHAVRTVCLPSEVLHECIDRQSSENSIK